MERIRQFLNKNIYIFSVRQGLLLTIPFLILGSFSMVIMQFPLKAWQELLPGFAGGSVKLLLMAVYQATFGSLSFIFALMISYSYGEEQTVYKNTHIFFPAVALCSFIAFTYPSGGLSIWGPEWSFTAICITLISCFLLTGIYHWVEGYRHLYTMGVAYNFNASMQSMIPAVVTIGLWFFGIHGTNTLEAVSRRLFESEVTANQAMAAQGLVPTHMFSKTFLDTFVFIGGSGCALCMVLALFLAARKNNNRRLAKLSLPAVVFNINELVLFGFPIIFSADMILPFILTPMVLSVISSFAMWFGLVPVASRSVEWTVPVLASGYLATGSVSGSLLQAFNLIVGTMIYIPFIKQSERVQDREFLGKIKRLEASMNEDERSVWVRDFRWNTYENQQTAKLLASDLEYALSKGALELYYQPQVKRDGTLYGCEALLRWNYMGQGFVYPPLIIALAVQGDFIGSLGMYIVEKACRDMAGAHTQAGCPVSFSVNILPLELEDPSFADQVLRILKDTGVEGSNLTIELTEQVALNPGPNLERQLEKLRESRVRISMDDFGMGHGSLNYLNSAHYDEVKIDGSLIRRLPEHTQTCELVGNIMNMSRILGVSTVAECVETPEQIQMLEKLGCSIYQGYYYSRPLPLDAFIEYVKGL